MFNKLTKLAVILFSCMICCTLNLKSMDDTASESASVGTLKAGLETLRESKRFGHKRPDYHTLVHTFLRLISAARAKETISTTPAISERAGDSDKK